MRTDEAIATATVGVEQLLKFTKIYYRNFQFLDLAKDSGVIKLAPNAKIDIPSSKTLPTKIANSTTFYTLSCALLEIEDLREQKIIFSDLVERVLDLSFRGSRYEIGRCLNVMVSENLVEVVPERVNKYQKYSCLFTDEFMERLRGYTVDICEATIGRPVILNKRDWLRVAREIFDFMRFKQVPQWYLLVRRVLRVCPSGEAGKRKIYDSLYGGPEMWCAFNYYMVWASQIPEDDQRERRFGRDIAQFFDAPNESFSNTTNKMIASGFSEVVEGALRQRHAVAPYVAEYVGETNRFYNNFSRTISSLLGVDH